MRLFALTVAMYWLGSLTMLAGGIPDPRAKEVDWSDKNIRVQVVGDTVQISFQTGGMAGKRLIKTQVQAFSDNAFATLTYQVVQNFAESYKHMEGFEVTWRLPKDEYEKLRQERKFYLLRLDEVILTSEEVKEIQSTWKTRP